MDTYYKKPVKSADGSPEYWMPWTLEIDARRKSAALTMAGFNTEEALLAFTQEALRKPTTQVVEVFTGQDYEAVVGGGLTAALSLLEAGTFIGSEKPTLPQPA